MKTYIVRVTENVNHEYLIKAESEQAALDIYESFNYDDLKEKDEDGSASWDSPWDIEEEEGEE